MARLEFLDIAITVAPALRDKLEKLKPDLSSPIGFL